MPPSGHLVLCLLAKGPAPSSCDGSYFELGVTYSLLRALDLTDLPHPPHLASPSFIFFNHTQNVQKSLFIDLFAPVLLDLPSPTHPLEDKIHGSRDTSLCLLIAVSHYLE